MKLKDLIEQYGEYEVSKTKSDWCDAGHITLELNKPKPKTVWDLEHGDEYVRITGTGGVSECEVCTKITYDRQRDVGNVFLTKEEAEKLSADAAKVAEETKAEAKKALDDAKTEAEKILEEAKEKAEEVRDVAADTVTKTVEEVKETAEEELEEVKEAVVTMAETAEEIKDAAEDTVTEAKEEIAKTASEEQKKAKKKTSRKKKAE